MPYELFHNKAAKFGSPQLTIRGGRIAFNADAGDILAGVGMRYAHLLFDVVGSKIAIHPVQKEDEYTFSVSIPQGKRGGTISAQSFLNYIRWHADNPIVVDAHWDAAAQLMEASLPKQHLGSVRTASGPTGAQSVQKNRPRRRRVI
jgi:hypothetical protein